MDLDEKTHVVVGRGGRWEEGCRKTRWHISMLHMVCEDEKAAVVLGGMFWAYASQDEL